MNFLPIIILGIVFLLVAFVVTEKNAKYLLASYNVMSSEEQVKFNLLSFLTYFKKFHVFLGVSILFIGFCLELLIGKNSSIYFLMFYPLLAYIYFVFKTKDFYQGSFKRNFYVLVLILGITIIGLGYSLFWSHSDNAIEITNDQLIISGSYGFEIPKENIDEIALVDSLPQIVKRTNGLSSGQVSKGRFKTADGRTIRLFLNNKKRPRILILAKGREIYYSSKEGNNSEIYQELLKNWKVKK